MKSRNWEKIINIIMYAAILITVIVLIMYSYIYSEEKVRESDLTRVDFVGEYTAYDIEGNTVYENKQYNRDEKIDQDKIFSIIYNGHFNANIEKNKNMIFRFRNIRAKIFLNDKEIYSYGQEDKYLRISKSPGNTWETFTAPEIKTSDDVRIEIVNVYKNNTNNTYSDFIQQIYIGKEQALLQKMLDKNIVKRIIIGAIVVLSYAIMFVLLILKLINTPIHDMSFHFAAFAIASGSWILMDFDYFSIIIPCGVLGNILDNIFAIMVVPLLLLYIKDFVVGKDIVIMQILEKISLLMVIIYLVHQITGIADAYEFYDYCIFVMTIMTAIGVILVVKEFFTKENNNLSGLIALSVIVLFLLAEVINYFFGFLEELSFFSIGYVLFVIINFIYIVNFINKEKITNQELEKKLIESKISIMLSQIQPHFLYNTLAAIKRLCGVDPEKAQKAITDFSLFLRGNMDSLGSMDLIPFEREMEHVKNYLALEKMRFEERLNIVYNIDTKEFMLPSLTLQPLVENAVRYGITKKEEGGTVKISTREDKDNIYICIEDDGVGYNPMEKQSDGRTHIGIDNVKNRIKLKCNGKLEINSRIHEGTKITITFPKEESLI